MKQVLLIATGGTIACRETGNGLSPALTGEELLGLMPELGGICAVEVCDLMNLDSTDLTAADRAAIARTVWEGRDRFDGFVIAHGTDTLAYTAALLCHMLPGLGKPVVLTGSMLPMGAPGSDAPRNLLDAFRVAAADCAGVLAVLHGKIIPGSHVCKRHSSEADAFVCVNAPLAGTIDETGRIRWETPPQASGKAAFIERIDPHVLVVKLTPDLEPSFFSALHGYPKVILEAFGAGGVPQRLEQAVRELIGSGTRVYITTQCAEGGVDLHKYEVGRRAEAMGAVSLGNRTTEDALAAIMCGEI